MLDLFFMWPRRGVGGGLVFDRSFQWILCRTRPTGGKACDWGVLPIESENFVGYTSPKMEELQ